MVNGFTKFKEKFQGFENQYVIIGGTACDLIMENEELPFRATKDVDIVLIVESITAEFGRQEVLDLLFSLIPMLFLNQEFRLFWT